MEQETPLTDVKILIETSEGNIIIKLYDETPLHRDNFVKLVKSNFYDGIIFHRVIPDFMIQGGDPDSRNPVAGRQYGFGGLDYTIPAEIMPEKYIHKKGVLAAARDNNPEKRSSSSQFYIVQGDIEYNASQVNRQVKYTAEQLEIYKTIGGTPHLDGSYTVYGEVVEGLDIVDKIAAVKTLPGDRPVKDVFINKMTIVE